jgi:transposase
MKNHPVFKHVNQDIYEIFDRAEHPQKVLIVALDYAKQTHKALICSGAGASLKAPFDVENTPEGLRFLQKQIEASMRRHAIPARQVIIGGEDCGSFSLNFVHALGRMGYLVIGVHAKEAKKQRENYQASTDKLDLLGIVKMLLDRRGSTRSRKISAQNSLRNITRHRAAMVRNKTALSNRIHSLVDQVFPGFLDESKSGIPPFSPAACGLMRDRFSPAHFRRRKLKALSKELQKYGLKEPEKKAAQLLAYAGEVLEAPPELVGTLQSSLRNETLLYKGLLDCIEQIEKEIALLLAPTPGALLTTIKGTGITLAAGVSAEIGPMAFQNSLRRLTSYAGIVPRVKQTGGPQKEASHGTVSKRCNRILKNYIVQCGCHLGQHGPDDLREDHHRRTSNGQHADFGMARKYLRIASYLMRYGQVYLPHELRKHAEREDLKAYYLEQWPVWRKKWEKTGALTQAFSPENPLGIWRIAIQEIYEIRLPL